MLRILLAEDHPAVRRGIRSLIESHPDWQVASEATNGREAVEQAEKLKPDLVILDVTMPECNGLEASRLILKQAPDTKILLLTVHQSDELSEEARRIGAQAIIFKPDADQTLIAAIERLLRTMAPVHLAGAIVRSRHVGAFFRSADERYHVLGPFVAEGLAAGEKAFHIINPPDRDLHLQRLREGGADVDRAVSQRQMELVPWESMYLRAGHFDKQAMLGLIQQVLVDTKTEGFPRTRLVAHMEWALEPRPGVEDLIEYEALVNDVLPRFDDVAICAYDLTKFDGSVVIDAIRSHPAVVIGGSLHDNPFYLP